ncbi:hypothetical protein BS50DRAFT_398156 [Corynespora cassiicola Philippines]|uniref:Uncharacterized protein n=1 Tax=Corynespora cassiicola Philippines TaxID=1448308 RepID=A0A2T2NKM8_CORCC|nr:hypothetical protein BS50DRAFT_398156 [Corynespora cassiicola Philippines]
MSDSTSPLADEASICAEKWVALLHSSVSRSMRCECVQCKAQHDTSRNGQKNHSPFFFFCKIQKWTCSLMCFIRVLSCTHVCLFALLHGSLTRLSLPTIPDGSLEARQTSAKNRTESNPSAALCSSGYNSSSSTVQSIIRGLHPIRDANAMQKCM